MTRDDKRRKQRQDDHRLKTAADPEKLAEERELRASMGLRSKAGQRQKNEG